MSANIWDKFDSQYDTKAMAKETDELAKNGGNGNFEKVPYDTYIVKVEKLELGVSKENKPKLICWFKIVEGQQKNKLIFMNQSLTSSFGIHNANEFLRSLKSGLDVVFETFSQYNQLVLDIHEAIDGKVEYQLKYAQKGNTDFDTFEILEDYEV